MGCEKHNERLLLIQCDPSRTLQHCPCQGATGQRSRPCPFRVSSLWSRYMLHGFQGLSLPGAGAIINLASNLFRRAFLSTLSENIFRAFSFGCTSALLTERITSNQGLNSADNEKDTDGSSVNNVKPIRYVSSP